MTEIKGHFVVTPGDSIGPGDWVCFGIDGKLRRAVAGVDRRGFMLPPSAKINAARGTMEWDANDPSAPDISRGSPELVWAAGEAARKGRDTMREFQKVRLSVAHGPDVHFEGIEMYSYSTQRADGGKSRWTDLRLWETKGGAWVAEMVGRSTQRGEFDITEATVIEAGTPLSESIQRVMTAWGWTSAAKAFARERGWDIIRRVE
jgi:hypothetical protein